jgi:hypothetical protein
MLPKNLKYGNKVEAAMARSYTSNLQPNGALGGYLKNTVTTIYIPTGRNLTLVGPESVLKFRVKSLGTGNGRLDSCGAHGFIQRIRVFHGSNMLEDTDQYGQLAKIYFDMQVSSDACFGKYSILAGTRSDMYVQQYTTTLPADASDIGTNNTLTNAIKAAMLTGSYGVNINNGELIEENDEYVYTLSLISILGTLSSANYFPLFACTGAQLRLEIQWAPSIQAVGAFPSTTTGFQIDDVEFIASYLALSDTAMGIIASGLNGPLSFTTQGVRNYNYSYALANGTTTLVNVPIPAKFGSVKSIITTVRDTARAVNTALYYPFSSTMFGLNNYYFKIGSNSSIPSIAPNTEPQFFCEALKAVSSISDLNHHPSIDLPSYTLDQPIINTSTTIDIGSVTSGCFYTGLDLENYAESDKSTIYTGYNTNQADVFQVMNFTSPAAIASARFDSFVMFDQEIIFENDTCYTQF